MAFAIILGVLAFSIALIPLYYGHESTVTVVNGATTITTTTMEKTIPEAYFGLIGIIVLPMIKKAKVGLVEFDMVEPQKVTVL